MMILDILLLNDAALGVKNEVMGLFVALKGLYHQILQIYLGLFAVLVLYFYD